jgi:hypothetical protein
MLFIAGLHVACLADVESFPRGMPKGWVASAMWHTVSTNIGEPL